jgi:inosose dehydratase
MPTRRHFLQRVGAGAAASLAAHSGFAQSAAPSENPLTEPEPKQTFQLGLASYTFYKFPLEKALAMTKRVGLKHICLNPQHLPLGSTPDQIAQTVAKVRAVGLDLYGGGVIYMEKPADVDRAFDYAKTAGMRVIVGRPLPELLPAVNKKVQKYDIRLAIHNHGPGDKVFPTPDIAYEKIKTLDPRVGLCIDIGHTVRSGVDPSRAAEQFADRLLDIHIKDVTAAAASGTCTEAGRGVIDLPKFLRTLKRIRYAGIVSFEFEKDPDDPLPGLAESVGYVRGVLAAI